MGYDDGVNPWDWGTKYDEELYQYLSSQDKNISGVNNGKTSSTTYRPPAWYLQTLSNTEKAELLKSLNVQKQVAGVPDSFTSADILRAQAEAAGREGQTKVFNPDDYFDRVDRTTQLERTVEWRRRWNDYKDKGVYGKGGGGTTYNKNGGGGVSNSTGGNAGGSNVSRAGGVKAHVLNTPVNGQTVKTAVKNGLKSAGGAISSFANSPGGQIAGKTAGVGGAAASVISQAPKTWNAAGNLLKQGGGLLTWGAGKITGNQTWQNAGKAWVIEGINGTLGNQSQNEWTATHPDGQTEIQKPEYPFEGGQTQGVTYKVNAFFAGAKIYSFPNDFDQKCGNSFYGEGTRLISKKVIGITPIYEEGMPIRVVFAHEDDTSTEVAFTYGGITSIKFVPFCIEAGPGVFSTLIQSIKLTPLSGIDLPNDNPPPIVAGVTTGSGGAEGSYSEAGDSTTITPPPPVPKPPPPPTKKDDDQDKGKIYIPYFPGGSKIPFPKSADGDTDKNKDGEPDNNNKPGGNGESYIGSDGYLHTFSKYTADPDTGKAKEYLPDSDTIERTKHNEEAKKQFETFYPPPIIIPNPNGSGVKGANGDTVKNPEDLGAKTPDKPKPPAPPTSPPDCNNKCSKGMSDKLDTIEDLVKNNLGDVLQSPILTEINNRTKVINNKMGNQIKNGGLSGAIGRLHRNLGVDRWLNLMNSVLLWHNAFMLSNSITTTAMDIVDNVMRTTGLKFQDAEGDDMDFSEVVKVGVRTHAEKVLGKENVKKIIVSWAKANRIYQAATNMLSNVRSMFDSTRDIVQTTGEEVGIIGNALRDHGVLPDDAYKYMPEKLTMANRFIDKLEKLEDTADALENITSETASIKEDYDEIFKEGGQRDEFKKAIDDVVKPKNEEKTKLDNEIAKLADPTDADTKKAITIAKVDPNNP